MTRHVRIPAGMIFVRDESNSHNPDEDMTLENFDTKARALLGLLMDVRLP